MLEYRNIFADNEYIIMSEIIENEKITQRELSKKLGVSVSTVNLLISKMIREGLVKMMHVSQKQVFYMLTPVGMMEKAKKTVSYLKAHYKAIYRTKETIKVLLEELVLEYNAIILWINDKEMRELISTTIDEFVFPDKYSEIIFIENGCQLNMEKTEHSILLYMEVDECDLKKQIDTFHLKSINLVEKL